MWYTEIYLCSTFSYHSLSVPFKFEIRKSRGHIPCAMAKHQNYFASILFFHLIFPVQQFYNWVFFYRYVRRNVHFMSTLDIGLFIQYITSFIVFQYNPPKTFRRMLSKGEQKHKIFLNHTQYYIVIKHLSSYECTDNFFFTISLQHLLSIGSNVIPWYQNTIEIHQHSNSFPLLQFTHNNNNNKTNRCRFHCNNSFIDFVFHFSTLTRQKILLKQLTSAFRKYHLNLSLFPCSIIILSSRKEKLL